MKNLYSITSVDGMTSNSLIKFKNKRKAVLAHKGAESVFSVFAGLDIDSEFLKDKASCHSFYTPKREGLEDIHTKQIQDLLLNWDEITKSELYSWLEKFCKYNSKIVYHYFPLYHMFHVKKYIFIIPIIKPYLNEYTVV